MLVSSGAKLGVGTLTELMFDIFGEAFVRQSGLKLLPALGTKAAGSFFVPVLASSLVSTAVDLALENTVTDYNTRFAISTAAGLATTVAIVGIGTLTTPVSLPFLAGVAIAWGASTALSYFLGKLG
jgi:hypothetical protein